MLNGNQLIQGNIEEKAKQIKLIETTMNQIHEISEKAVELIEQQGKVVDEIEGNVVDAEMNVDRGIDQMEIATESQKDGLNWLNYLLYVIVALVLLVLLINMFV